MSYLPCRRRQSMFIVLMFVAGVFLAGCARLPYRYGGEYHTENDAALAADESQIERGRRAPVIDTVGWIVGIPSKILMFNHHINNHNVSPETEKEIEAYLANNDLDKVKVRIDEYDPFGEWRRLGQNKSVGWPARYTLGTLSCLGYTIFPGRIWGGDHYNPYTNSIYLYSDVPSMALYEGGHAKDFAQREYKGWYAVGYELPLVNLWHHSQASSEALGYLRETEPAAGVKEGYRTVAPAYAIDATQGLGSIGYVPIVVPAAIGGHLVGQVKAASFQEGVPPQASATETSPETKADRMDFQDGAIPPQEESEIHFAN
jgi:hypothetical protein